MQSCPCLWHPGTSRQANVYVAFQSRVYAASPEAADIRLFGCSFYRVYLDGEEIHEGPARFGPDFPEYDVVRVDLQPSERILTVVVHDYGEHTRMLMGGFAPFLQCEVLGADGIKPLRWLCKELDEYRHMGRRINAQLGWMEVVDTRLSPDFGQLGDGADWVEPIELPNPLGDPAYAVKSVKDCAAVPVEGERIGQGTYVDRFGYADDDPPVRFLLRDLAPGLPADGTWLRFDLGKVALYRPAIEIDAPEGTLVEAGYSEYLTDGRVAPFITLSAGASCHMDRWVTRGGRQTLRSFSPRGFRYLEAHIAAPREQVRVRVVGWQRTLYEPAAAIGAFRCSDELLNRIWEAGAETLRSCSEDALIDSPTRERGQWTGDAAVVGIETLAVVFGDLSLIRRGLRQASERRNGEGLAAGLCPGQEGYLTSFALYWVQGCMRYSRLTGDRSLLAEGYDTANRTIDYFWNRMTAGGTVCPEIWDFLDWGHNLEPGEANVSLNLLLYACIRELIRWEETLGVTDKRELRERQLERLGDLVDRVYRTDGGLFAKSVPLTGETAAAALPGFHANVFGLAFGMLSGEQRVRAIAFVKEHILACFPNRPEAPRLSDPAVARDQLITPNFAHFFLQVLWEAGEANFVLQQYRTCWGWMLEQGATTLLEVFDTRWSHCHAWSACPTWQLSRYALGLLPSPGGDAGSYELLFQPGGLSYAEGRVPLIFAPGVIQIRWERDPEGGFSYELATDRPIRVRLRGERGITSVTADGTERRPDEEWTIERHAAIRFA